MPDEWIFSSESAAVEAGGVVSGTKIEYNI
jgi:hypothetical protein